jgi:hypothetical protein
MEEIVLKMASDKGFEKISLGTYVGNCVGNEKGFQPPSSETLVPLAPQTEGEMGISSKFHSLHLPCKYTLFQSYSK